MDWMNQGLAEHDSVGLSMFDYGFRQTTTQDIVVNKAEDLKGVKIRVPPSTGLLAAFDAIGANTQRIAYSELYTSLKQGVVAAEENPVFTILADSLFETQNQLALTNHYFDCQILLANKMFFDGLSPELQAILKEEAVKAQNLTRERISHGEAAVVEELVSVSGLVVADAVLLGQLAGRSLGVAPPPADSNRTVRSVLDVVVVEVAVGHEEGDHAFNLAEIQADIAHIVVAYVDILAQSFHFGRIFTFAVADFIVLRMADNDGCA